MRMTPLSTNEAYQADLERFRIAVARYEKDCSVLAAADDPIEILNRPAFEASLAGRRIAEALEQSRRLAKLLRAGQPNLSAEIELLMPDGRAVRQRISCDFSKPRDFQPRSEAVELWEALPWRLFRIHDICDHPSSAGYEHIGLEEAERRMRSHHAY